MGIGHKLVPRPELQPAQCPACKTEVAAGKISGLASTGQEMPTHSADYAGLARNQITLTSVANVTVAPVQLAFSAG